MQRKKSSSNNIAVKFMKFEINTNATYYDLLSVENVRFGNMCIQIEFIQFKLWKN